MMMSKINKLPTRPELNKSHLPEEFESNGIGAGAGLTLEQVKARVSCLQVNLSLTCATIVG